MSRNPSQIPGAASTSSPAVSPSRRGLDSRLWRINAWLFLLLGLGGIATILTLAVIVILDRASSRRAYGAPTASVTQGPSADRTLKVGRFLRVVDGSPSSTYLAPLESDESLSDGYIGSKEGGAVRNYLFYDSITGKSRWLLPDHSAVILEASEWPNARYGPDVDPESTLPPPAKCRTYEIVVRDSNDDGRLSYRDRRLIAISKPDGAGFVRLIADVDETLGSRLSDDGSRLEMFYLKDGLVRLASIDIVSLKITNDVEVPLALAAPAATPTR